MAASHLTSLLLGRSRSVKNGVLSYKVAAAGEKGTLCLRLQIAREQQRQGCYSILQHTVLISVFQACANICEYHMCIFVCVCARLSQYALQIAEEWLRADSAAQLSISRNGSKMRCFISGVQNQFRSRKTCWQRADFCCVLQILLECLRQCWCLLQLRAPSELLQQACCGPFMFCRSEWGEVGPGSVFDFPK